MNRTRKILAGTTAAMALAFAGVVAAHPGARADGADNKAAEQCMGGGHAMRGGKGGQQGMGMGMQGGGRGMHGAAMAMHGGAMSMRGGMGPGSGQPDQGTANPQTQEADAHRH